MWKEFKAFLIKDNVIWLAIAVILGGVFNSVVKSIVDDVLMPIITSAIPAGIKWQEWGYALPNGNVIKYGNLIAALINFLIIGFILWRMSKIFVKPPESTPAAPTKVCPYCKSVVDTGATRCPNCTSQL